MNSTERKRCTWEETLLVLAHQIAKLRSPDPWIQVGACAQKYDSSLIIGYNGAPPGIEIDWNNRDERRKRVIHAEANVLGEVKRGEVKILAVTHLPCPECIKVIAQKKIPLVIYGLELENYDNALTKQLAKEFAIDIKQLPYVL